MWKCKYCGHETKTNGGMVVNMGKCPKCKKSYALRRYDPLKEGMKQCPFESYNEEVNESRCTVPMDFPKKVTYGKYLESWFCIYRNKYEECPLLKKLKETKYLCECRCSKDQI